MSSSTFRLTDRLKSAHLAQRRRPAEIKAFRDSEEVRLLPFLKAAGIKPTGNSGRVHFLPPIALPSSDAGGKRF